MSHYTTEVRFICESYAGLEESQGYTGIDEIVEKARPKIFDFPYPIFDEEYRPVLERKILKHFYTREICAETVGLWKLWLNSRMNEIMPYYNQLYNSELIKFDPMTDVNVKSVDDNKNVKSGNITDNNSADNQRTYTGKNTDTRTPDLTEKLSGTDEHERAIDIHTEMNGTVTDHILKDDSTDRTGSIADNGTNNQTRTDNLNELQTNGGSDTVHTEDNNKNDHWDYYSDTPQGQLSGIENNTYLTNVRHVTDDKDGSEVDDTTTYGKTVNTENTGTQTNNATITNTKTFNHDRTDYDADDTNTRTYDTDEYKHGTDDTDITYGKQTRNTGTETTEHNFASGITDNGHNSGTKTYNNVTDKADNTNVITGKRSFKTFSKMLEEYRETFLNIDMQVINSLNDLFMLIW